MSSFSIGEEAMRQLVQKAVFDSMTEEVRQKLIVDAIRAMFSERVSTYDNRTKFEELFRDEVRNVARGLVKDMFADPEGPYAKQMESVIHEATTKAFSDERRYKLVESMAESIASSFKERY